MARVYHRLGGSKLYLSNKSASHLREHYVPGHHAWLDNHMVQCRYSCRATISADVQAQFAQYPEAASGKRLDHIHGLFAMESEYQMFSTDSCLWSHGIMKILLS